MKKLTQERSLGSSLLLSLALSGCGSGLDTDRMAWQSRPVAYALQNGGNRIVSYRMRADAKGWSMLEERAYGALVGASLAADPFGRGFVAVSSSASDEAVYWIGVERGTGLMKDSVRLSCPEASGAALSAAFDPDKAGVIHATFTPSSASLHHKAWRIDPDSGSILTEGSCTQPGAFNGSLGLHLQKVDGSAYARVHTAGSTSSICDLSDDLTISPPCVAWANNTKWVAKDPGSARVVSGITSQIQAWQSTVATTAPTAYAAFGEAAQYHAAVPIASLGGFAALREVGGMLYLDYFRYNGSGWASGASNGLHSFSGTGWKLSADSSSGVFLVSDPGQSAVLAFEAQAGGSIAERSELGLNPFPQCGAATCAAGVIILRP